MKYRSTLTIDMHDQQNEEIAKSAQNLFLQQQQILYKRTDQLFARLMIFQWLASIVLAGILSPHTWMGPVSHVHPHIFMAVFLGGAVTFFPVFLIMNKPGEALTRHSVAIGQLLMSGILIHITDGRIETHFHIFGSLAFIAFYRDWRVLTTATIVVALDHFIRGAFAPMTVFGVPSSEYWRWLEHMSWVVFEDAILMVAIAQSVSELHRIAERQAMLELSTVIIKKTEEELKKSRVLENAVEGISQIDKDGRFISVNLAFASIFGYTPQELSGMQWLITIDVSDHAAMIQTLSNAKISGKAEAEATGMRKDGTVFYTQMTLISTFDDEGSYIASHCFLKNISERKALEAKISHQAFHDALTGLPNRILFTDRVQHAFDRAQRLSGTFAVMFLDIDNFKSVNDSLGHDEGDRLLISFARILQESVRPGDTVARMGGDEFTILLEDIQAVEDASRVADRIMESLLHPIALETRVINISSSMGIALSSSTPEDTETLLRNADTAMYLAKTRGKAGYVVFEVSMNQHLVDRLELESALREAVRNNDFQLKYQPVVNMETGEIVGAEALLRWHHIKLGEVAPEKFIPIAEQIGLLEPMGLWVLRQACRQAKIWQEELSVSQSFVMSVNLSTRQFHSANLLQEIKKVLLETGLEPHCLELEITESTLNEDVEATIKTLNLLKELGVLLAVDDFGTGYNTLSYLKRLPVDSVKIDRSFINIMDSGSQPASIVHSIIMLCRALNLSVSGAGIENADQLVQLQLLGCDLGQGYHFSTPIDGNAFLELLKVGFIKREHYAEIEKKLQEYHPAAA